MLISSGNWETIELCKICSFLHKASRSHQYRTWGIEICIPTWLMSSTFFTMTPLYSIRRKNLWMDKIDHFTVVDLVWPCFDTNLLRFVMEIMFDWKCWLAEGQHDLCENEMISMSRAWDKEKIWVPDRIRTMTSQTPCGRSIHLSYAELES